jgi:hypothetical protein
MTEKEQALRREVIDAPGRLLSTSQDHRDRAGSHALNKLRNPSFDRLIYIALA